jgi:hypothetical protein
MEIADDDPFVKIHKVRRGIDMRAFAERLCHATQERNDRTFAVRPRDVHDRRQPPLRPPERGEQPLDALE